MCSIVSIRNNFAIERFFYEKKKSVTGTHSHRHVHSLRSFVFIHKKNTQFFFSVRTIVFTTTKKCRIKNEKWILTVEIVTNKTCTSSFFLILRTGFFFHTICVPNFTDIVCIGVSVARTMSLKIKKKLFFRFFCFAASFTLSLRRQKEH